MRIWIAQLRKGLVELAVLAALRQGEAYGYELLRRLRQLEGLSITESTVYPLLARLADDGLVSVRAAPSPAGPPRRYYQITRLGRSRLREMAGHWDHVKAGLDQLLNGESP